MKRASLPAVGAMLLVLMPRAARAQPCDVTVPNNQPTRGAHGNSALSVMLGRPDGIVVFKPGGPGFVLPDGALSMKFGWTKMIAGELMIDGHRLDTVAAPLRASIPAGYGAVGFQATMITFPTPGCWSVTGHVADSTLTFVTRIVKIDTGPQGKH